MEGSSQTLLRDTRRSKDVSLSLPPFLPSTFCPSLPPFLFLCLLLKTKSLLLFFFFFKGITGYQGCARALQIRIEKFRSTIVSNIKTGRNIEPE